MYNDAFWERSGFVVVENSEVKLARSAAVTGWVTCGEASRQAAPESKTIRGESRDEQYRYRVCCAVTIDNGGCSAIWRECADGNVGHQPTERK